MLLSYKNKEWTGLLLAGVHDARKGWAILKNCKTRGMGRVLLC